MSKKGEFEIWEDKDRYGEKPRILKEIYELVTLRNKSE